MSEAGLSQGAPLSLPGVVEGLQRAAAPAVRRWLAGPVVGPHRCALEGESALGARLDDERRHLGLGVDEESEPQTAQVLGDQIGGPGDYDLAGLGMSLEAFLFPEGLLEPRGHPLTRRELTCERRAR